MKVERLKSKTFSWFGLVPLFELHILRFRRIRRSKVFKYENGQPCSYIQALRTQLW